MWHSPQVEVLEKDFTPRGMREWEQAEIHFWGEGVEFLSRFAEKRANVWITQKCSLTSNGPEDETQDPYLEIKSFLTCPQLLSFFRSGCIKSLVVPQIHQVLFLLGPLCTVVPRSGAHASSTHASFSYLLAFGPNVPSRPLYPRHSLTSYTKL